MGLRALLERSVWILLWGLNHQPSGSQSRTLASRLQAAPEKGCELGHVTLGHMIRACMPASRSMPHDSLAAPASRLGAYGLVSSSDSGLCEHGLCCIMGENVSPRTQALAELIGHSKN